MKRIRIFEERLCLVIILHLPGTLFVFTVFSGIIVIANTQTCFVITFTAGNENPIKQF